MTPTPTSEILKNLKYYTKRDVGDLMIEFAKTHVTEALKQASDKASIKTEKEKGYHDYDIIDKESILTAYPLELIK